MLTAFLIMISSAFSLNATSDRTAVYINVAAMACLVVVISLMNFNKIKNKRDV